MAFERRVRHRLQVPPVEGVEAEWQRPVLRPRVRLGVWVPRVVLRGWHRLRVPQVPRVEEVAEVQPRVRLRV